MRIQPAIGMVFRQPTIEPHIEIRRIPQILIKCSCQNALCQLGQMHSRVKPRVRGRILPKRHKRMLAFQAKRDMRHQPVAPHGHGKVGLPSGAACIGLQTQRAASHLGRLQNLARERMSPEFALMAITLDRTPCQHIWRNRDTEIGHLLEGFGRAVDHMPESRFFVDRKGGSVDPIGRGQTRDIGRRCLPRGKGEVTDRIIHGTEGQLAI